MLFEPFAISIVVAIMDFVSRNLISSFVFRLMLVFIYTKMAMATVVLSLCLVTTLSFGDQVSKSSKPDHHLKQSSYRLKTVQPMLRFCED